MNINLNSFAAATAINLAIIAAIMLAIWYTQTALPLFALIFLTSANTGKED